MLGGFVEPQVRAYTGYAYPVIFGKSFMRDEATGLMLLDSDGMPMTSGESTVIGKCTPDFNMGWSTNIRYKRFNLSSTWSWQKGGQMYHGTYGTMQMFGRPPSRPTAICLSMSAASTMRRASMWSMT